MEPQEKGPPIKRLRQVVDREKPPSNRQQARANWKRARASLLEALDQARKTQTKRQHVHEAMIKSKRLAIQIAEVRKIMPDFEQAIGVMAMRRKKALDAASEASARHEQSVHALSSHDKKKPDFFARLIDASGVRDWQSRRSGMRSEVRYREGKKETARKQLDQINQRMQASLAKREKLKSALQQMEHELQKLTVVVSKGSAEIKAPCVDGSLLAR